MNKPKLQLSHLEYARKDRNYDAHEFASLFCRRMTFFQLNFHCVTVFIWLENFDCTNVSFELMLNQQIFGVLKIWSFEAYEVSQQPASIQRKKNENWIIFQFFGWNYIAYVRSLAGFNDPSYLMVGLRSETMPTHTYCTNQTINRKKWHKVKKIGWYSMLNHNASILLAIGSPQHCSTWCLILILKLVSLELEK